MPALTQQERATLSRFEPLMNRMIAFMERATESAAERAARLGAESACGSEQDLADADRKHYRALQDPTFARFYFAAQRQCRNRLWRAKSGVRGRRTFNYNGHVITETE